MRARRKPIHSRRLRFLAAHRRSLALGLLVLPALLVVLLDLSVRGSRLLDLRGKYVLSYAAAVLESGALWGLLLAWASARRGLSRWLGAALFVVLSTLALGGQTYFHTLYSIYLNVDATRFGSSLTSSMFGYLRTDLSHFLATMLPPLVASVALVFGGRLILRTRRKPKLVIAPLALIMVVAVFLIPCSYRSVQGSTPDVIYFHAFGGLIKQLSGVRTPEQVRPGRRSPPKLLHLDPKPPVTRNVLFIFTEGVRSDMVCSGYTPDCPISPEMNQALPGRLPLRQLRSDSSNTATQLAVLWSGLPANATRQALHTAPLVFEYAAAAGLESAYWTSHHPLFANSLLWWQDLPTRFQVNATQLDPLADIDACADDRLLTKRVKEQMPLLKEPFLAVVQYGNTHMPYLVDPTDQPFSPAKLSRAPEDNEAFRNRYKNAVHYQDKTIADLLRFVRASPFGARTVIVFTSDHAEAFREHDQLGHTASVFEVEVHVPGWIDAPSGMLTAAEIAALQSYADHPVFSSDLAPTMLDLLGLWDAPEIAPYRQAMVGTSLLRPGAPERLVAMTNCTGVWGCAFQNWGVMLGWRKLLAREWDQSWLCYDVHADPEEKQPLNLTACADLVEQAQRIYGGLPSRQ